MDANLANLLRRRLNEVRATGDLHDADQPVKLFPLDGRPHLAHVQVETTDVSSYQALLEEVTP